MSSLKQDLNPNITSKLVYILLLGVTIAADCANSATCIDPDLAKVAQGTKFTMCDGTVGVGTYVAPNLSNLTSAHVKAGVSIGNVTGIWSAPSCNSSLQTGCIANVLFPSISAASAIDPYDLLATPGGSGKFKYCRAGYNLSVYDHPASPVNMNHIGKTFTAAAATDLLSIANNTFIQSIGPVPIRFTTTGTLPAPLVAGTTYYSIWVSSTTIKIASSPENASSSTSIDLTDAGSGTHKMFPVGDGVAQYWDVGKSLNSITSTPGPWFTDNYFGSQYLCTLSDWQVLAPSIDGVAIVAGSSADCDSAADECMFQDLMTKQVWTEVNPSGGGANLTWAEARKFCDDLVYGGFSDWRLPQIKEFAQGYIDGLARTEYSFPSGGSSISSWMWSATSQGGTPWDNSSNFIYRFYGSGEFQTDDATGVTNVTRCIRN